METRFRPIYLLVVPVAIVLCLLLSAGIYNIPAVHDRLAWRIESVWVGFRSAVNPPEKIEFVPQAQVDQIVQATLNAAAATRTPTASPQPTNTPVGPTETPTLIASPTVTPTPLPLVVNLPGVKYETQKGRWNYCGPANLSMALTFWGWPGDRDVVGQAVKPNEKDDKNVMPYEMEDFVETQTTDLAAIVRHGGDLDLLRRMVAAGFPVIVEKGYHENDVDGNFTWMGHYQFVTGYDVSTAEMVVQDTYNDGPNFFIGEEEFIQGWRAFNFIFIVVYPRLREAEVLTLLGDWSDPTWALQHALETAVRESQELSGADQYFAWFNRGTAHVSLQQYAEASLAYDQAFLLYTQLPDDGLRPFRMLWYQTGPYFAYYYTGRYQDVLDLANVTFETIQDRLVLEESLYWRAMAKAALNDTPGAVDDLRKSLEIHPGFPPSVALLSQLGFEQ